MFKHFKIEFESTMQNHLNGSQCSWFRCLWIRYSCKSSRELVKLRHLFPIFSQTLLSLSRWENEPQKCSTRISMLHVISRAIWFGRITGRSSKIHRMDFFKGIFSSVLTDGTQMKPTKWKFRQWWNCNIYRNFLSRSSTWQFFIMQWLNPTEMLWYYQF